MQAAQRYRFVHLTSSVSDSSSLDLLILCYKHVIDQLLSLRACFDLPPSNSHQRLCNKILEVIRRGLIESLNSRANQEISKNLLDVYEWSLRQIFLARALKDKNRLDAVVDAYRVLLSGWEEVRSRGDFNKHNP